MANRTEPDRGHQKLRREEFTKYMTTDKAEGAEIEQRPYEIGTAFTEAIQTAIKCAPKGKAAGRDEIFSEALKCAPEEAATLLTAIWRKCNHLKVIIGQWNTATVTPIYKKGPEHDPKSYRPIAVLSHGRKVIDAAIARMINAEYKNHGSQLGFQRNTGTETAIIRHIGHGEELKYSAVLDLQSAYDRVPRNMLMREVTKRLPKDTAGMVSTMMKKMEIVTAGDLTETKGYISRGVPQGSPLSPCLFNLYMDTYPEYLTNRTPRGASEERKWAITMFADDVKVMAADTEVLQALLHRSAEWATNYGMKWSTQKCVIVTPPGSTPLAMKLSGDDIRVDGQTKYLGFQITHRGVLPDGSVERLKRARGRLHILRNAGIHAATANAHRILQICDSLILSTALYGIHMTPNHTNVAESWAALEKDILILALGCFSEQQRSRLRDITKTTSLQETRGLRWEQTVARVRKRAEETNADEDAKGDERLLAKVRNELGLQRHWTKATVDKRRRIDNIRRERKLPNGRKRSGTPSMFLTTLQTKRAAFQWYCGRFPTNIREIKHGNNAEKKHAIHVMTELMRKTKWTKAEKITVTTAINTIKEENEITR